MPRPATGSRRPTTSRSSARSDARRAGGRGARLPRPRPRHRAGGRPQLEPIGPGSAQTKVKDPGGAAGDAPVALAIARRTRALLLARGYRVAMTRDGTGSRGGNRERARFCSERGAALMLRI